MLLTRSPLTNTARGRKLEAIGHSQRAGPFDLHVSGTPPAFILSQDQTLRKVILELQEPLTLQASYHSSVVKVLHTDSIPHLLNRVKLTEAYDPRLHWH